MRLALIEVGSHGGLLHYAVQLADALAVRGHAVDLIVPSNNELRDHEGPSNMRPILIPVVPVGRTAPRSAVGYQLQRVGVAVRLLRSLGRAVLECRRGRYDAVVLQWDVTLLPVWLATQAATRGKGTFGFILHNARPFNRWRGTGLFRSSLGVRRRLGTALSRFEIVFVHGDRSRDEVEQHWPAVPVAVIPHGDERILSRDLPPAVEERLLFFGEWRKYKGLDLLMEVFDELLNRRPDARLTIAGTPTPGDYDDRALRSWASRHGECVTLVPRYVPIEELADLFAAARVVVTPYLAGSQSGVVHLAMTMARPVVTADVGDLAAAVDHGETGFVVPVGDRNALVEALATVLADATVAKEMGEAGRRKLERSASWEFVAERVEQELLHAGSRTAPRRRRFF